MRMSLLTDWIWAMYYSHLLKNIFIEHCDVIELEITNISEFTHMSGRPRCRAQAPGRSGCEASVPSQRQCGEVTMEPGWGYGEATGPRYSLSCLALPRQCTVRCTSLSARPTFIFSLQQWQCLNQHNKYYILVCVKLYKCTSGRILCPRHCQTCSLFNIQLFTENSWNHEFLGL